LIETPSLEAGLNGWYINEEAWNGAAATAASPMGTNSMAATVPDVLSQQIPSSWISLPNLL
jgi:hypothetical protein